MPIVREGKNLYIKIEHQFIDGVSVGLDGRTPGKYDGRHYTSKDLKEVEIALMLSDGRLCMEPLQPFTEYWDGGVYGWVPVEMVNEYIIKHNGTEIVGSPDYPLVKIVYRKEGE